MFNVEVWSMWMPLFCSVWAADQSQPSSTLAHLSKMYRQSLAICTWLVYSVHMKKITVTEFRKNIKKHLDYLSEGNSLCVRGVILEGSDFNEVMEKMQRDMAPPIIDSGFHAEYMKKDPKTVDYMITEYICGKCDLMHEMCYKLWEEGEDHIVCLTCIKKTVSSKILKSYLCKLEKL